MDAVIQSADVLASAFWVTIQLFLIAGVGSLILGTLIASMRVSPVPPLRWFAAAYVRIVRNTPLTIVLFMAAFGLPEVDVIFSFFTFAAIGLTVYTASFVAEAVRSGINAVPVGQAEAARSIGLTFTQTMRLVVLPQALRTVVPPIGSVQIALLKNTSVAAAVGVGEAMQVTQGVVRDFGNQVLAILAIVGLTYAALALIVSAIVRLIERRLAVDR
jgi:glutamate transport system permease protein